MKSPDLKIGRFKDFDVANNNVKVNLSRKHGLDIVGLYIYIYISYGDHCIEVEVEVVVASVVEDVKMLVRR